MEAVREIRDRTEATLRLDPNAGWTVDESIAKLDTGDYGFCEVCGVEIGIRRLEARPTATQCIDCKTLDEIKERHLG